MVAEQPGDRLIVPHPRWQERAFVQAPLADLWPRRPAEAQQAQHAQQLAGAGGVGGSSSRVGVLGAGGRLDDEYEGAVGEFGLEWHLQQARRLWEESGGEKHG